MTLAKYTTGFILSLILTLIAYGLVVNDWLNGWLLGALGVLALIQMIVQLVFFLHLGDETGPRYRLWSFVVMAIMLAIVVAGSIWIMQNMDYNMLHMNADGKTHYMITQHDKGF
jgi:cytochrome o ubiquinol oxidase operon protein cyoD